MQLSDPVAAGALEGVRVIMSEQGESCDHACSSNAKKQKCSTEALQVLNTCDSLREHVGCEAGCEAASSKEGGGDGRHLPAYVDGNAPKAQRPAMCFTAAPGAVLGCSEKDAQSRRLCACK